MAYIGKIGMDRDGRWKEERIILFNFFSKDIGIDNILSYRNINIFYFTGGIDR